ncbi:hypothetical protein CS022_09345 [Veronia nyctiphanis]|uniref:histidine kinase n=1 Tax=Veronia nyctiphanis TaxID=1278244 RepID=A0A4Q0YS14_9GAMM|nr:PAS domain S-box protein [Veronia nyctiphanis]RXJ73445.1 hypothetical protein CS022_09345 [Veronia nyctiphanis]
MTLLETLQNFYRSGISSELVIDPLIDPWLIILALLFGFNNVSSALHFRPQQQSVRGQSFFKLHAINGVTLAIGIWVVQGLCLIAMTPAAFVLSVSPFLWALVPLVIVCLFSTHQTAYGHDVSRLAGLMILSMVGIAAAHFLALVSLPAINISNQRLPIFLFGLVTASVLFSLGYWHGLIKAREHSDFLPMTKALLSGIAICLAIIVLNVSTAQLIDVVNLPEPRDVLSMDRVQAGTVLVAVSIVTYVAALANFFHFVAKKRHRILKTHTESLETMIQTVQDGVIAVNSAGLVTLFNPAAEMLFGWSAKEVIGRNVRMLIGDEHRYRHDEYINRFFRNQTDSSIIGKSRELTAMKKNGMTFPIRLTLGFSQRDAEDVFIATVCDISEQRQQTQSLRENAKQYRTLIANLPALTFREMTRGRRQMVYVSDSAKQLTGFTASALTGEHGGGSFVDHVHEDDQAHYMEKREEVIRQCCHYEVEYRFVTRNEEVKWLLEVGHSYRSEDGGTWIDGLIFDVSERKQKELVMNNKVEQASRLTESKSSFLNNMGTEFRTPLNSMLGLADVLLESVKEPEQRQHLEVMRRSGNALLTLINDAMEASRFESRAVSLEMSEFSLLQLCQQIEFIARETSDSATLDIQLDYSSLLNEHFIGDARRLKQLLHNMVRNTLIVAPGGGIRLHVYPWEDGVRLAVSGYSSLPESASEAELNQSISSKLMVHLVELMDGFLWYDVKGRTSIIYADIPLACAKSEVNAVSKLEATGFLNPVEIVVVDRLARNQKEISAILLKKGARVQTFTTLSAAVNAMETNPPDMLLIDAYEEGVSEWKGLQGEEQAIEPDKLIPQIIGMAVSADPTPIDQWLARGFDQLIQKPVDTDAMYLALRNCVDQGVDQQKITPISLKPTEATRALFNQHLAMQHWQNKPLFAKVLDGFWTRYHDFPNQLQKETKASERLSQTIKRVRASSLCMGFERYEHWLDNAYRALQNENATKFDEAVQQLESCLSESYEKAFAYLGIRPSFPERDQPKATPSLTIIQGATTFIEALESGQLDEESYFTLILTLSVRLSPLSWRSLFWR